VRLRLAETGAIVVCLVVPARAGRSATQHVQSVWGGVYTKEQADRGKAVYTTHCGRCHRDDLAGNGSYPLAGEGFMDHWEAHTLEHLFRRIRDSMPPDDPLSVTEADKRDALAYLLQQNGFPAGSIELAQDEDARSAVQIARKSGPGGLKTGALVRVSGCLAHPEGHDWKLTDASEPERTTLDAAHPQPGAIARGTRTIRLLNAFPSPAAHVGHTMQAIGFLMRDGNGDAINVVSLETLTPNCEQ
jgi:S-disulfanyl-L-cysteine oxidoreductase SoxD